jgi:large subunit ribosomal protein L9
MKVVFLEDVEGTAQVGEIKDVKNGFARNYLLPRGLAAPAVEPYLERANARAAREAKKQDTLDKDASAVAARLEGARVTMTARVGEQGKLYGSVTSVHIADEVAKLIGSDDFDHRKVLLPEAIKEVGVQPVRLRLTRNVEAAIEVEVVAEGVEEEPVPLDSPPPTAEVSTPEAKDEDKNGDDDDSSSPSSDDESDDDESDDEDEAS